MPKKKKEKKMSSAGDNEPSESSDNEDGGKEDKKKGKKKKRKFSMEPKSIKPKKDKESKRTRKGSKTKERGEKKRKSESEITADFEDSSDAQANEGALGQGVTWHEPQDQDGSGQEAMSTGLDGSDARKRSSQAGIQRGSLAEERRRSQGGIQRGSLAEERRDAQAGNRRGSQIEERPGSQAEDPRSLEAYSRRHSLAGERRDVLEDFPRGSSLVRGYGGPCGSYARGPLGSYARPCGASPLAPRDSYGRGPRGSSAGGPRGAYADDQRDQCGGHPYGSYDKEVTRDRDAQRAQDRRRGSVTGVQRDTPPGSPRGGRRDSVEDVRRGPLPPSGRRNSGPRESAQCTIRGEQIRTTRCVDRWEQLILEKLSNELDTDGCWSHFLTATEKDVLVKLGIMKTRCDHLSTGQVGGIIAIGNEISRRSTAGKPLVLEISTEMIRRAQTGDFSGPNTEECPLPYRYPSVSCPLPRPYQDPNAPGAMTNSAAYPSSACCMPTAFPCNEYTPSECAPFVCTSDQCAQLVYAPTVSTTPMSAQPPPNGFQNPSMAPHLHDDRPKVCDITNELRARYMNVNPNWQPDARANPSWLIYNQVRQLREAYLEGTKTHLTPKYSRWEVTNKVDVPALGETGDIHHACPYFSQRGQEC